MTMDFFAEDHWETRDGQEAIIWEVMDIGILYPIKGSVGYHELSWSRDGLVYTTGQEDPSDLMRLISRKRSRALAGDPLNYFRELMGGRRSDASFET